MNQSIEETERVIDSAIGMQEYIEETRENEPTGKFRRQWVKDMNNMIDTYNKTYGKTYNRVK